MKYPFGNTHLHSIYNINFCAYFISLFTSMSFSLPLPSRSAPISSHRITYKAYFLAPIDHQHTSITTTPALPSRMLLLLQRGFPVSTTAPPPRQLSGGGCGAPQRASQAGGREARALLARFTTSSLSSRHRSSGTELILLPFA